MSTFADVCARADWMTPAEHDAVRRALMPAILRALSAEQIEASDITIDVNVSVVASGVVKLIEVECAFTADGKPVHRGSNP